jgi:hypothetical protein
MHVKLFSGIFNPGSEGALELEINNWFNAESEASLVNMAVNMSQRDDKIALVITVLYDYLPQDV